MPRAVRTVLHALSYGGIEVDASRKLADIKKMDPMRIFYKTLDAEDNKSYLWTGGKNGQSRI